MSKAIIIKITSEYKPSDQHNKTEHERALEEYAKDVARYARTASGRYLRGAVDVDIVGKND